MVVNTAALPYVTIFRDNGARKTGLTPTWVFCKKLSDLTTVATPPAIVEIGYGQYRVLWDPEANGEICGQLDGGATISNEADRFVDFVSTRIDAIYEYARASAIAKMVMSGNTQTIYKADNTTVLATLTFSPNDGTPFTQKA